ncbi:MAG: hypothetical protein AAF557_12180 [Pseudomonadota bacterium]
MRAVAGLIVGAAVLLAACAQEPEAPPSDLSLGLEAIKKGELPAAEQHFNKILAENPNDAYANLNIGLLKARTGRREEAIGHYQLAAANGEDLPVLSIVRPGEADAEPFTGTVADVARRNLANLGV